MIMNKQTALNLWKKMYTEINKDNWLYVGTINPDMVKIAIEAIEKVICDEIHDIYTSCD